MDFERLLEDANEAMSRAYAPYSGFHVGAALLGEDGSVHVGCNVENASYGLTMCAERSAVASAVGAGVRTYRAIAIVTDGDQPVAPCVACRQVLAECGPGLRIASAAGGKRREWSLNELLPEPFEGIPGWGSPSDD